jgi:hypothetical protein
VAVVDLAPVQHEVVLAAALRATDLISAVAISDRHGQAPIDTLLCIIVRLLRQTIVAIQ